MILDLILEVPRPRQLHEIHSSTLGSAGDFNLSHLSSLSSHVAKVGRQRSFPLLRGVLASTVTLYTLQLLTAGILLVSSGHLGQV